MGSQSDPKLEATQKQMLKAEVALLFQTLTHHNAEFGFRVVHEMARFSYVHKDLSVDSGDFRDAWDSQILQKVSPKLHGSRRKLEPILLALSAYCYWEHKWSTEEGTVSLSNRKDLEKSIAAAAQMQGINPLSEETGARRQSSTTPSPPPSRSAHSRR